MKKFEFTLKCDYGRNGPKFYRTDERKIVEYSFSEFGESYMYGRYFSHNNGPNTAYATIFIEHRWAKNNHFGFYISKRFCGRNSGNKARAWLNYMLNNPPNYVEKYNRKP